MPKMKVNPNAQAPSFEAVVAGEYSMKFERLPKMDDRCKKSEKGNWYVRMLLKHLTPTVSLTSLTTGQPFKVTEFPSAVFVTFMMDPEMQGTLRQAFEAVGLEWPQDPNMEIDEEWIQAALENKEVGVRLKTSEYKGDWKNEVARFLVPEQAA